MLPSRDIWQCQETGLLVRTRGQGSAVSIQRVESRGAAEHSQKHKAALIIQNDLAQNVHSATAPVKPGKA